MWSAQLHSQALSLRQNGLSLNQLCQYMKLPKSTIHGWIQSIPRPKLTKEGRKIIAFLVQPLGAKGVHAKRMLELAAISLQVDKDLETVPTHFNQSYYRSLLAMLYWAEGAKTYENKRPSLVFANTDPLLCQLYISLLRASYSLDESKFRVILYLHYYHDIQSSLEYWSKLLNIPLTQFGKIRLKRRAPSRFRANHHGICFIRYYSVDLQHQITTTAKVLGNTLIKHLAPVA
jgi:hypothetical protein